MEATSILMRNFVVLVRSRRFELITVLHYIACGLGLLYLSYEYTNIIGNYLSVHINSSIHYGDWIRLSLDEQKPGELFKYLATSAILMLYYTGAYLHSQHYLQFNNPSLIKIFNSHTKSIAYGIFIIFANYLLVHIAFHYKDGSLLIFIGLWLLLFLTPYLNFQLTNYQKKVIRYLGFIVLFSLIGFVWYIFLFCFMQLSPEMSKTALYYPFYCTLLAATALLVFRDSWYATCVAGLSVGAILVLFGFFGIYFETDFNPNRHLVDLFVIAAFYLCFFAKKNQTVRSILKNIDGINKIHGMKFLIIAGIMMIAGFWLATGSLTAINQQKIFLQNTKNLSLNSHSRMLPSADPASLLTAIDLMNYYSRNEHTRIFIISNYNYSIFLPPRQNINYFNLYDPKAQVELNLANDLFIYNPNYIFVDTDMLQKNKLKPFFKLIRHKYIVKKRYDLVTIYKKIG